MLNTIDIHSHNKIQHHCNLPVTRLLHNVHVFFRHSSQDNYNGKSEEKKLKSDQGVR